MYLLAGGRGGLLLLPSSDCRMDGGGLRAVWLLYDTDVVEPVDDTSVWSGAEAHVPIAQRDAKKSRRGCKLQRSGGAVWYRSSLRADSSPLQTMSQSHTIVFAVERV